MEGLGAAAVRDDEVAAVLGVDVGALQRYRSPAKYNSHLTGNIMYFAKNLYKIITNIFFKCLHQIVQSLVYY